jgi:hypothetical protein
LRAAQPCGIFRREGLRKFGIATPVDGNENLLMAEVVHRYVRDPKLVEEREAAAKRREEAAKKREEAAKRRQAAKSRASRATWRGIASLRLERTAHERAKRLQREMQITIERGELIEKELVLQQAGFLLVAMRQRCMSAPSAWARRLLNIGDAREMTERLKDMMTAVLEDLADLPERVTAGELNDDVAPARKVNNGNGDD